LITSHESVDVSADGWRPVRIKGQGTKFGFCLTRKAQTYYQQACIENIPDIQLFDPSEANNSIAFFDIDPKFWFAEEAELYPVNDIFHPSLSASGLTSN